MDNFTPELEKIIIERIWNPELDINKTIRQNVLFNVLGAIFHMAKTMDCKFYLSENSENGWRPVIDYFDNQLNFKDKVPYQLRNIKRAEEFISDIHDVFDVGFGSETKNEITDIFEYFADHMECDYCYIESVETLKKAKQTLQDQIDKIDQQLKEIEETQESNRVDI